MLKVPAASEVLTCTKAAHDEWGTSCWLETAEMVGAQGSGAGPHPASPSLPLFWPGFSVCPSLCSTSMACVSLSCVLNIGRVQHHQPTAGNARAWWQACHHKHTSCQSQISCRGTYSSKQMHSCSVNRLLVCTHYGDRCQGHAGIAPPVTLSAGRHSVCKAPPDSNGGPAAWEAA